MTRSRTRISNAPSFWPACRWLAVPHDGFAAALLARVTDLNGGRSLDANIALIRNNAALAADIAVALQRPATL